MLRLKKNAWVLVADGEKALFLRNDGNVVEPELKVLRLETGEAGIPASDRPGRMADPGAGQRSAVEETDWHRIAKENFAAEIAGMLNREAQAGRFDDLIVVAPPLVLGALREKLDKAVKSRLVAEIDKDFTNLPLDKIGARLVEILDEMSA